MTTTSFYQQVVKETKFLEIVFDSKLSVIPHIKYLKAKCLKAINLLRVVAHIDWGADYTALCESIHLVSDQNLIMDP